MFLGYARPLTANHFPGGSRVFNLDRPYVPASQLSSDLSLLKYFGRKIIAKQKIFLLQILEFCSLRLTLRLLHAHLISKRIRNTT